MYSLLGWTTRGRHHTPVFRMFDWPLHRDFSLLFAIGEVGSFTCIGCDSPIHGTDGLESPPKDLAMRIKRLAKGRYCRGGIWTHAEPPVWKFAVYTLALRPLGHDSSSWKKNRHLTISSGDDDTQLISGQNDINLQQLKNKLTSLWSRKDKSVTTKTNSNFFFHTLKNIATDYWTIPKLLI